MGGNSRDTIFDDNLELEWFCVEIVEKARTFYENNPKWRGSKTVRERIEFFFENDFQPALENAIEDTFESEEQNDY
jgi:hypothetical protein